MVSINASVISVTHTVCASSAFIAALVVGYKLHFYKIVSNAHYSYPDEWFPSVSATIGDRYPERSIFQILIALTAFPRFLLLLTHYALNKSTVCFIIGVVRTVTCGGWVYITSTDDHDIHDIFMISYIVLTLPWDLLIIHYSPYKSYKKWAMSLFFGTLFPLVYWFIQHQVLIRPGAYSIYAYFEWALIILDISFDSLSYPDFKNLVINLKPTYDNGNWFFKFDLVGKTEGSEPLLYEEHVTVEKVTEDDSLVNPDETNTDDSLVNLDETNVDDSLDPDYLPIPEEEYGEEEEEESFMDESAKLLKSSDDEIKIMIQETEDVTFLLSPTDNAFRPPSQDSLIYILTNIFNSFMFWSVLTSLLCIVWYFPLWYMGISGYEASIMSVVSPILLYIPLVPVIIHQYGVLMASVIGISAYMIEIPESRLLTVALSTGIMAMNFAYTLKTISTQESTLYYSLTWMLGLVCSVILKMGFFSNNPIWPIMNEKNGGWNKTGLGFALFFSLITPYTNSIHYHRTGGLSFKPRFVTKLTTSFGFGALMFAIHQLLTDASTLVYWSWEGWNTTSQGPLTWPTSAVTCAVLILATVTSSRFFNKPLTPILLLTASSSVLCFKRITGWPNYVFGGLPYATSILWLVPTYFSKINSFKSIWVFVAAFFTYDLLVLAHVWTVAYAFVPYGWVLRERLEYVLAASTVLVAAGVFSVSGNVSKVSGKFMKKLYFIAVLLLGVTGMFTYQLRPTGVPQPYHPEEKLITAGIWTIHFGLDNDMWASEQRMIDLIREMELDVVGLLETDTQRITMGNRDLTNKMAHDLNMYADYGPGPNKHTWGCVLLSKFPIVNSTHFLLPSPVGELAPAIHATLKTYDEELVDVFVFHSGQEEDVEDRRLQSEALAELMGSTNRPTFLLSYLVTDPLKGNYNKYVSEQSGMYDIDPTDDDRWCEYILFKKLRRTGYARISRGTITDTELQVGKFQVLSGDQLEEYGDSLYENIRVDEVEEVEEGLRFPDLFYGEGVRGHRYHVFDEPRYYNL